MFPGCSICKMKPTDTQSRYQNGMSISEDIIVLNTNIVLSKLTQGNLNLHCWSTVSYYGKPWIGSSGTSILQWYNTISNKNEGMCAWRIDVPPSCFIRLWVEELLCLFIDS